MATLSGPICLNLLWRQDGHGKDDWSWIVQDLVKFCADDLKPNAFIVVEGLMKEGLVTYFDIGFYVTECEKVKWRQQLKDSSGGDAKPNECRINSLPESILLHILSFLTFKEAVKCSVLSKEWRNLYTVIPVIDFGHVNFLIPVRVVTQQGFGHAEHRLQKPDFLTIVDRFLLSHDAYLREFKVKVTLKNETTKKHLETWLRSVVDVKKVEELSLTVETFDQLYSLPLHLFNCTSVLHLTLGNCNFESRTDGVVMFPALKTLILHISTPGAFDEGHLYRMLGECPQLKSLTIQGIWVFGRTVPEILSNASEITACTAVLISQDLFKDASLNPTLRSCLIAGVNLPRRSKSVRAGEISPARSKTHQTRLKFPPSNVFGAVEISTAQKSELGARTFERLKFLPLEIRPIPLDARRIAPRLKASQLCSAERDARRLKLVVRSSSSEIRPIPLDTRRIAPRLKASQLRSAERDARRLKLVVCSSSSEARRQTDASPPSPHRSVVTSPLRITSPQLVIVKTVTVKHKYTKRDHGRQRSVKGKSNVD
ncbi:F-box/FBD/LRR-repeat protein [Nymphaea thermarum]|nr:F-box/FBD/LRR-repeat protein [Nymphaea thermarum]